MKLRMAVCLLMWLSLSVTASAHARVTEVRDVENPARTPFVIQGEVLFASSELLTEVGEVPAGKRAVIEFISMECATIPPDTIVSVLFTIPSEALNGFAQYHLPIAQQGVPGDSIFQQWVAAQLVRIYADVGPISIQVSRSSSLTPSNAGCSVTISGHTIDVNGS
jgi:hypothetical protein